MSSSRHQSVRFFTRRPSPGLVPEGVTLLGVPDDARALHQHHALCDALHQSGAGVTVLPAGKAGSFLRTDAVITARVAIFMPACDPDFASRLAGDRVLKFVTAPGCASGRDVLQAGDDFYISLSADTNEEGAAQIAFFLHEYGYRASILDPDVFALPRTLRLSGAVARLNDRTVIVREEFAGHFAALAPDRIVVPNHERAAAGALCVNQSVLLPTGCSQVKSELRDRGFQVLDVPTSEFDKAGATLSCLVAPFPERDGEKSAVSFTKDKKSAIRAA